MARLSWKELRAAQSDLSRLASADWAEDRRFTVTEKDNEGCYCWACCC